MDGLKDLFLIFLIYTPFLVSLIACFYVYKYKKCIQVLQNQLENETINQREYFTQTIKHDLKVPTLAQLRGLDLLKNGIYGELNKEQRNMIEEVQKSCKYVLDMIATVLKTYRIESKINQLQFERFSVMDLVLDILNEKQDLATSKKVDFEIQGSTNDIEVEADREELKKVIENLLLDAVFYSNNFEKVSICINSDDDCLSFSITSKGVPLSKRECSTLFEYFSPQKIHYGAIGERISLYLSKKIIDMHNGKIFVMSDGIEKNTFNFIIPMRVSKSVSDKLHSFVYKHL